MDVIDNKSVLVQVMAWRIASDKPLLEPIMIHFTDTIRCYQPQCVIINLSLDISLSVKSSEQ